MIAYINGTLTEKQPARVVVEAGGIGYEVFIPVSSYDRLPAIGQPCRLMTHDHVREDAHQLFGFATDAERRMFLLLIQVSGIGPKLAINTLSGLPVRELTRAIADGDVKRLSQVSGIGRKTAERIIVELRDRLSESDVLEAKAGALPDTDLPRLRDAVLALVALGHKEAAARKMVTDAIASSHGTIPDVEEIVRRALGT